jgi:hypothetical protein
MLKLFLSGLAILALAAVLAGGASFLIVRGLDDNDDDSDRVMTSLASYAIPAGEAGEGASVQVIGADEPRREIASPAMEGEPTPRPTLQPQDLTPTDEAPAETASPTPTLAASPPRLEPAPGGELVIDSCVSVPLPERCPIGILGTVAQEEGRGSASLADTGDPPGFEFVQLGIIGSRDLLYPIDGFPEECSGPGGDEISFLVQTTNPSAFTVTYWPVRYIPTHDRDDGLGVASSEDTRIAAGAAGFAVAGHGYAGCARIRPLTAVSFEIQVTASDAAGNVIHSPVLEFCISCSVPLATEPLEGFDITPHANWAEVTWDNPPGAGRLEFAYRWAPGGSAGRWRSVVASVATGDTQVEIASEPNLWPDFEYEAMLVFHRTADDITFASNVTPFRTLRQEIRIEVPEFNVIVDGDASGSGELLWITQGICWGAANCAQSTSLVAEGNLRASGASRDDDELPVDDGDAVTADPVLTTTLLVPSLIRLDVPNPRWFYLQVVSAEDDSPYYSCLDRTVPPVHSCDWNNGTWWGNFELPPYYDGEDCTFIFLASSDVERASADYAVTHFGRTGYFGDDEGAVLEPTDARYCLEELRR